MVCSECNGTGRIDDGADDICNECSICGGTGEIEDLEDYEMEE